MEFTRNCPRCNIEIKYQNIGYYNRATKENRHCRPCSYVINGEKQRRKSKSTGIEIKLERNCPRCSKKLTYKVYHSWWWANKKNKVCGICCKKGIPHNVSINTPWKKTCPVCAAVQFYHTHRRLKESIKNNSKCRSCSKKEYMSKIPHELSVDGRYKRECPKCSKEILYKHYASYTKSVKKNAICQHCSRANRKGTKHSRASIQKMREAIQGRCSYPNYNKRGCEFMDSLKPEYNFQHALNTGEFRVCGYSVDGYDKEKNIVFEYDEPYHFDKNNWTLKEHDVKRMEEIKDELGCKFLRYDERNKLLTIF